MQLTNIITAKLFSYVILRNVPNIKPSKLLIHSMFFFVSVRFHAFKAKFALPEFVFLKDLCCFRPEGLQLHDAVTD